MLSMAQSAKTTFEAFSDLIIREIHHKRMKLETLLLKMTFLGMIG